MSVISATGKGKHYAQWKAEKEGKPTIRSMIRGDIDRLILQSYTFNTFFTLLEREGYAVRHSPNRKCTTVRPPGAKRAIRLDSLGEEYTEEAIKQRIIHQRTDGTIERPRLPMSKKLRIRGRYGAVSKRKIKGFLALYLRYVYLLRKYQGTKRKKYISFALRQEVIRLDRYRGQFAYLHTNHITAAEELEQQISQLTDSRNKLYKERLTIKSQA